MATNTQTVTGFIVKPNGDPFTSGIIRFTLGEVDTDGNEVISQINKVEFSIASDGAVTAELWPNTRGSTGSVYLVQVREAADGALETIGRIQVPDAGPYDLATLMRAFVPEAASTFFTALTEDEFNTKIALMDERVAATAADRVQTGLDRVQTVADASATAADRVQTGLDRIATAADLVETAQDVIDANTAKDAAAVSASDAAAAVDGVVTPLNSEILWPASLSPFPNGWYDTTLRLLSGTAARAILSNNAFVAYAANNIIPQLVVDFKREFYGKGGSVSTFSGVVTHARLSSATYTDSAGLLQTAATGVARVGNHVYNGTSWVNEGLLLESAARTNFLTYSDYSSSIFTSAATYTANNTDGALGVNGLGTLIENTATSAHLVIQNATVTAAAHTHYVIAKSAGRSIIFVYTFEGSNKGAFFDLSTGTITSESAGCVGFIEPLGSGFYKCGFTYTYTGTSGRCAVQLVSIGTTTSYTGDGSSGVIMGAGQLEAGSTPSSYIPTAGSTVTRAAETLTVAAADMPAYTTAVSIQMDGQATYADTNTSPLSTSFPPVYYNWELDTNNRIAGYTTTDADLTIFRQWGEGTSDSVSVARGLAGVNVPFSVASRHGSTFVNGAVDGTALTANTTPVVLPDLSATDFEIGSNFMGNIGKARVWPDDIADIGIAEASA